MDYVSTRNHHKRIGASAAILAGLAEDGGLYVPATFPALDARDFSAELSLPGVARTLLAPFVGGDPLEAHLDDICAEAFSFPAPLAELAHEPLRVLELFHGPTAAFKDFGARFLAACFARSQGADDVPVKILVATSGDTGGAVAAAFHGRPGLEVDVFYPAGLVSPRQEHQLTCWTGNVRAFRVAGSFDACQSLVKAAFQDADLSRRRRLTSANSINLGRLLPQMVYYAATSLAVWRQTGQPASFVIPTGNLGNAVACTWAQRVGLPIGKIHLATNANRTIPDFLADGEWRPRASVQTLANAMDVGDPSNMERLRDLVGDIAAVRAAVSASAVDDRQIERQIAQDFARRGQVFCPHTATALHAYDNFSAAERAAQRWVVVATAHPAKFDTVVEPLIGEAVAVPDNLAALLTLPTEKIDLAADVDALRDWY